MEDWASDPRGAHRHEWRAAQKRRPRFCVSVAGTAGLLLQVGMFDLTFVVPVQILEGSFSAASKPDFASKHAFESSRRALHNALLCTALESHFLSKFAKNFAKLAKFLKFFANFHFNFGKILANFEKNSEILCNFLAKL